MNAILLGILCVTTYKDVAQSVEVSILESQQATIEVSQVSCDIPESINATCEMCVNKGGVSPSLLALLLFFCLSYIFP